MKLKRNVREMKEGRKNRGKEEENKRSRKVGVREEESRERVENRRAEN